MKMDNEQLAAYHLAGQVSEIAEMSARTEPFEHTIAGVEITVLPEVYPGGIDSELTIEAIGNVSGKSVLDLCTGTGIIAVKAALEGADNVVAVDLNPEAVKNARLNAKKFNLRQIEVHEGSLFTPVGADTFDVVAMNPPYTSKKPMNKTEICFWDEDNQTTRSFFEEYKNHLNPGGQAYLAWADFSSIELIEELAETNSTKLELVRSRSTRSGLARFLVYRLVQK